MNERVLVVDDDVAVRESLKKVLQGAGYEVVLAAGGLEAVGGCELEQIGAVLLDLNLPNQCGWEVFEHLAVHYPGIPTVIITGLPGQYRTAVAAGVDALMEKPIEAPTLLDSLAELLAESPEARLRRRCAPFDQTRYVPAGCKHFLHKG
jgi:CheY-like chemotaxis protein